MFHKNRRPKDKGAVAILELRRGRQSLGIQKKGRQFTGRWEGANMVNKFFLGNKKWWNTEGG